MLWSLARPLCASPSFLSSSLILCCSLLSRTSDAQSSWRCSHGHTTYRSMASLLPPTIQRAAQDSTAFFFSMCSAYSMPSSKQCRSNGVVQAASSGMCLPLGYLPDPPIFLASSALGLILPVLIPLRLCPNALQPAAPASIACPSDVTPNRLPIPAAWPPLPTTPPAPPPPLLVSSNIHVYALHIVSDDVDTPPGTRRRLMLSSTTTALSWQRN